VHLKSIITPCEQAIVNKRFVFPFFFSRRGWINISFVLRVLLPLAQSIEATQVTAFSFLRSTVKMDFNASTSAVK